MTNKYTKIANLTLALFLTASFGDVEATDIKHTLIKTDQQLNVTYKALTRKLNPRDQKKLRKEQRAWIKQRDQECKTQKIKAKGRKWLNTVAKNKSQTECVIRLTQKRAEELKSSKQVHNKKSNIYPSILKVWHLVVDKLAIGVSGYILYERNDGELLITYPNRVKDNRKRVVWNGVYFYSGKLISNLDINQIRKSKRYKLLAKKKRIVFADKTNISIDYVKFSPKCPGIFTDYYLVRQKLDGEETRHSLIFYLIPASKKEFGDYCTNPEAGPLNVKFSGYFDGLFYLSDDTFLVHRQFNGKQIFIRFDSKLNSKSPLLGKRIFLMDWYELNTIFNKIAFLNAKKRARPFQYAHDYLEEKLIKRR